MTTGEDWRRPGIQGFTYDASGRVRVVSTSNLSDLKIQYADNALLWENVGTGSASFDTDENYVSLAVTAGQYEIRRSKQYYPYFAGNSQAVEVTFDGFETVPGVTKRMGYFSSNAVAPYDSNKDGFWLEDNGVTKFLVVSKNGVEKLRAPMSQWNEPEKFANYDWSTFTVIQFDYLWLGGAVLKMYVKVGNEFLLAYQFDYPGTSPGVMMLYPNQNIRAEVRSTTGAGGLNFVCCRVATEGATNDAGISQAVNTGHTLIVCGVVGITYPILAVRKRAALRNIVAEVHSIDAFVGSNTDKMLVTLQINPTLSAPLSYAQVGTSGIESALGNGTITVTSPGKILYSKYLEELTAFPPNNIQDDFLNNIGLTIENVSDQYVICVTPVTATTSVAAVFNTREY